MVRAVATVALALPLFACTAKPHGTTGGLARQSTGSIEGLVTAVRPRIDSVPFAKITLSPGSIETRTDSIGRFVLNRIPAGRYTMQITSYFSKPYSAEIEITPEKTPTVRVVLELDEALYKAFQLGVEKPTPKPTPAPPHW
jgi:hypothetical protein